jgi:hypothetical protein
MHLGGTGLFWAVNGERAPRYVAESSDFIGIFGLSFPVRRRRARLGPSPIGVPSRQESFPVRRRLNQYAINTRRHALLLATRLIRLSASTTVTLPSGEADGNNTPTAEPATVAAARLLLDGRDMHAVGPQAVIAKSRTSMVAIRPMIARTRLPNRKTVTEPTRTAKERLGVKASDEQRAWSRAAPAPAI